MFDEPRTNLDIIRDLIDKVKEHEWVEHYQRCGRGCCGEWSTRCDSCHADEGDYAKPETYRQHKEGCQLAALIAEAEAYLRVEERLADERENPPEPEHRPTSWERVASNG